MLDKIEGLRSLNTNVYIIQTSVLSKYQALNHFLIEHHPEAAVEVRDNYIHVMRQYYLEHFSAYYHGLKKLEQAAGDKGDLVGYEEAQRTYFFGSAKPTVKDKRNVFNIGTRLEVLGRPSDNSGDSGHGEQAIILSLAQEANKTILFEELFKNYLLALVDNAINEYRFITNFFLSSHARNRSASNEMAAMIFDHIFEPPIVIGKNCVKQHVELSVDLLGMLLVIRLVDSCGKAETRRAAVDIPAVRAFLDSVTALVWPRAKEAIELHIKSIRRLGAKSRTTKLDAHPHTASHSMHMKVSVWRPAEGQGN
ncbi:Vacuolar protein sorting-associated protein 52 [Spiromyces aspiralis]|uniref:Vacuolar protein sorting-associated protein 52 n=1 Tax=Spiromyces aspiralis TaxID=68401 RepID=A0ACC1HMI4_9FUNG|nr:Vacuolar protein sorting-associated protein 52 [Spiromyces aspiralis]